MSSEEQTPQQYEHVATEKNSAVALCYESYSRALKEAEEMHMLQARAYFFARDVYRKAMPPLTGRENIQNFIACIAHGMLMKIIEPADATRLLYAAQIAQSAADRERPNPKST